MFKMKSGMVDGRTIGMLELEYQGNFGMLKKIDTYLSEALSKAKLPDKYRHICLTEYEFLRSGGSEYSKYEWHSMWLHVNSMYLPQALKVTSVNHSKFHEGKNGDGYMIAMKDDLLGALFMRRMMEEEYRVRCSFMYLAVNCISMSATLSNTTAPNWSDTKEDYLKPDVLYLFNFEKVTNDKVKTRFSEILSIRVSLGLATIIHSSMFSSDLEQYLKILGVEVTLHYIVTPEPKEHLIDMKEIQQALSMYDGTIGVEELMSIGKGLSNPFK